MKKLTVKCWTDVTNRRGRDGTIHTLEPRYNYLGTQLCSECRHRSCAATRSQWVGETGPLVEPKLKGMCRKATPDCSNDFDALCRELGAPAPVEFKPNNDLIAATVKYNIRKRMVERYLHACFLKCRPVTITVKEGHRG